MGIKMVQLQMELHQKLGYVIWRPILSIKK